MSADGSVIVGTRLSLDGYWMWSEAGGYKEIGGFARGGGLPGSATTTPRSPATSSRTESTSGAVRRGDADLDGDRAAGDDADELHGQHRRATYISYGTAWGSRGTARRRGQHVQNRSS
jgi:hypothetical protein